MKEMIKADEILNKYILSIYLFKPKLKIASRALSKILI